MSETNFRAEGRAILHSILVEGLTHSAAAQKFGVSRPRVARLVCFIRERFMLTNKSGLEVAEVLLSMPVDLIDSTQKFLDALVECGDTDARQMATASVARSLTTNTRKLKSSQ